MAINPQVVTVYGRLSFPVWTYAEAVARNPKSEYPKKDEDITPEFNLLLEQPQLDKLVTHVRDVFLPFCLEQSKSGQARNALDDKQVAQLIKQLDDADWEDQPPYISIKPVNDKTAALAPEAVANLKIKGPRGLDIELKAIVNDESELSVPDPDRIKYPDVLPIHTTVHQMYPGAYVAATLNLYSFVSGKKPGWSAAAGVAVFKADADRFGGGVPVDMDDIFAD